jgi:hypothetical protein
VPACRTLGVVLAVAAAIAACDDAGTPFRPPPPASSQPVLIEQGGPVAIDFMTATPAAGSTVAGCGPVVSGCAGRVAMQFLLRAQDAGHVLGVRAFLHATNLKACLIAESGPFDLARGEVRTLSIVYDQSDDCGVPLTIATMAVVVEGTVEVASRRAWQVTYTFER